MDFFVYSQDGPDTKGLRDDRDLLEEHWAYMDRFADTMIARGPTLATDRETATGSLHVLGLSSAAAATQFVEREPNNQAGVYARHWIWAFENLLERTMWEFAGDADEPRFLILAQVGQDRSAPVPPRPLSPSGVGGGLRERLIVYGRLKEPESGKTVGVAVALQARDKDAALALVRDEVPGLDAFPRIEVHDWAFGGRR